MSSCKRKGIPLRLILIPKLVRSSTLCSLKSLVQTRTLDLNRSVSSRKRQNKERNKASVSIEGFEKQQEKPKSEDVIKTVVPEDARPKFKPVGKIDLDKFSGRRTDKVEKAPEKKVEPVVEQPVVEQPVAEKQSLRNQWLNPK